jgi:archaemetzincin
MDLQNLILVSFGYWEQGILQKVADIIAGEIAINVQIKEGHLDVSDFYDAARRQYDANGLLQQIDRNCAGESGKIIGMFNVDLFIPIFTYIFGQAFLGGKCGIVSVFRLSNERYGMPANEELLVERSGKEILHELGHTLGLIHCYDTDCVMHAGSYVEDIDQKGSGFCHSCRELL